MLPKRIGKEQLLTYKALNPGNLTSNLDRTSSWWLYYGRILATYPPINGAYTELFAAFSENITIDKTGVWGE